MAAPENLSPPVPTVAVGGIVFDYRHRVLLIRRGQPPAQGLWSVPGGKQEPNESLAEACVREVQEETGLKIEVKGIVALAERRLEGFHYVIIDFLAEPVAGVTTNLEAGTDVTEAHWVGMEQLPHYLLADGLEPILKQAYLAYSTKQKICPGLQTNNKLGTDFVACN